VLDRWDWLLIVASVVLGQFALLGIEFLRGQLERKQRQDDRRDDFRRQALLDLQDALYRCGQGLSMLKGEYLRIKAGESPPIRLTADPVSVMQDAAARIVMVTERVDDESLRTLVSTYTDTIKGMAKMDKSDEEAFHDLEVVWDLQRQANKRIGKLLRNL
jgi:hypothetical protein